MFTHMSAHRSHTPRTGLIVCGAIALFLGLAATDTALAGERKASSATSASRSRPSKARERVAEATRTAKKLMRIHRDVARMDNDRLGQLIHSVGRNVEGGRGQWSFHLDGVELMVVTDEGADRMRIISPVAKADKLSREELATLLEANFDRALDAKYTLWRGLVWAVYTHPLAPLTKYQFSSAARQVAALSQNFGTTYSSSAPVFGVQ
jgi:hypothetical protein